MPASPVAAFVTTGVLKQWLVGAASANARNWGLPALQQWRQW